MKVKQMTRITNLLASHPVPPRTAAYLHTETLTQIRKPKTPKKSKKPKKPTQKPRIPSRESPTRRNSHKFKIKAAAKPNRTKQQQTQTPNSKLHSTHPLKGQHESRVSFSIPLYPCPQNINLGPSTSVDTQPKVKEPKPKARG
ncbi:hypothetical protein KC19_1G037300 [Ceratodon purpureus]|uniref:Uncharacterized protein n=1 Tax=Ceratodon purpureus TaxID=3225 RepID=A0A8T0J420_CERPU|nr:hypothetical protein KC19_1G037300 [Ceratodon purpureus]